MKQKISIFLFALLCIGFSVTGYSECPDWKGINSVEVGTNSLKVVWDYGATYAFSLAVKEHSKPWAFANIKSEVQGFFKNSDGDYLVKGSVRNLKPLTTYTLGIQLICKNNSKTFIVLGTYKTRGTLNADGVQTSCVKVQDFQGKAVSSTSILFDGRFPISSYGRSVKNFHWIRYWEKGTNRVMWYKYIWWQHGGWFDDPMEYVIASRLIKGLKPNTTYFLQAYGECKHVTDGVGGSLASITFPIVVTTLPPPPCHDRVKNIRLGEVTATTATITWDKIYQWPFPEGAGYLLRYRIVGASSWESSVYVAPLPSKKLEGLKPATKYEFQIAARCSPYSISEEWMPISAGRFTTLPDKDQCGGKLGDFTAPSINNTNGNYFYNGTIESSKPIALQSATVTFKSGNVVELNPGFEVNVSQSGMFEASAYNRANCQASTATANSGRGIAQSANATESVSIAYPISATSLKALPRYGVYPNPNNGSFSIDFKGTDEVIKSITVYDMFGIRIFNKVYNRKLNVERYSLPLAKSGLYKIAIRSASGVAYETLLVEF